MIPPRDERTRHWAWRAGQVAQGLVMGVLLWDAVIGLLGLVGNVTIFIYQGY